MPRLVDKRLTTTQIDKLKPKNARYDVFDADVRGLGIRVATTGTKTFFFMSRFKGRMIRRTLGRYPALKLDNARSRARKAAEAIDDGTFLDDKTEETFSVIFDEWLRRDQNGNRSKYNVENSIRNHVLPTFKNRRFSDITRADIIRVLDKVVDAGAPIQANRVLAHLRRMFNWAVERGIIEQSPVAGIKAPTKENSRERVLTLDELAKVWKAAETVPYPWGHMVRMLILTGQRLVEVANAQWTEINLDQATWHLAAERTKNSRQHLVSLSDQAVCCLKSIPRRNDCDWLFTTTGKGPVKGFGKAKKLIDAASNVTGWTYHDIRRSFATHATEQLGISPVVMDRILNHVSGTVKGVAAVYQRGEYMEQRREALNDWGLYVSRLKVKD
jgi:integrase